MIEYKNWRKMLISGMICSLITIALGEMPIGWVIYPETGNKMLDLILGSENLSVLQMAIAVLFGAIFIPLQYYGMKAIAEIISKTEDTQCAKITEIGANAYAFIGGTVHVLCIVAMFLCKVENVGGLAQIPQSVKDFSLWILLPISVVFMIIYLAMNVAMAIPIFKGKTIFPKWAGIFIPITGKIVLNVLDFLAPNTELYNAIRMSNMGIGSLITFAVFWILLEKYQNSYL